MEIEDKLEAMSGRLEKEITEAVGTILERNRILPIGQHRQAGEGPLEYTVSVEP